MPIYEFKCAECAHKFEELCKSFMEKVPCPKCGSRQTDRLFSPFAVSGGAGASGASSCGGCGGGHCSTCH
ncbi:MAG TPA: zinc ribbon domain-containing protein [Firmicutes bacterium]|uniref:Zinc ribbon domain-containing protein n=1 Tax=Capillibacterium thermochitinicola TaxID=2699427 RepID=A0A8J6I236_9FIRM|nr:zinc ribbon domain-containing protein [Capillibacterium thermochitinicola]HHW11969.1 zinc ribbon domain-containing protein [Bacillota bacterium]